MSVIELRDVSRAFSDKEVLSNLSLKISAGEVFGLIGLNGAGKTTLIRTILGLIGRDKGDVSLLGMDPFGQDVSVLSRVGTVLEHNGFYGNLNVSDNLKFYAKARDLTIKDYESFYNEYVSESDVGKKSTQVKFFSRGEKMQCALFRAFMGWPELLIFDEPTVGLDIDAYAQFISMCKTAVDKGSAIFISSHHLEAIDQLCDKIGLLEDGKIKILEEEKKYHTWTIRILNNGALEAKDIDFCITKICNSKVTIKDDLYSFRLEHGTPETTIPLIVKALCELGCSIVEVRPEIRDIKSNLKNFGPENA